MHTSIEIPACERGVYLAHSQNLCDRRRADGMSAGAHDLQSLPFLETALPQQRKPSIARAKKRKTQHPRTSRAFRARQPREDIIEEVEELVGILRIGPAGEILFDNTALIQLRPMQIQFSTELQLPTARPLRIDHHFREQAL